MIDNERRKKLAMHLRHLFTGQIWNQEFEDRLADDVTYGWLPEQYYRAKECSVDDQAMRLILEYSWCLYSDAHFHKMIKKYKLSDEEMKEVARIILFLHSEQEYQWDYFKASIPVITFKDIIKNFLTLGKHSKNLRLKREEEFELFKQTSDFEFWPFKTRLDFENALKKYPFLNGKQSDPEN